MVFNYEARRKLEVYMQKKITVTRIAEALNVSRASVYNELQRGLEGDDLLNKDYSKYSADLAQKNVERALVERIR